MNPAPFSSLPLGVSDFHKLRETGKIYVDKTELIYQLASERGQFYLRDLAGSENLYSSQRSNLYSSTVFETFPV